MKKTNLKYIQIYLSIVLILIIGIDIKAQPALSWVSTYNGTGNSEDKLVAMVCDESGNVYATGYSYANSTAGYDYVTIKFSSSGTQLWVQRFNSLVNGSDYPAAIALDGSGNVLVTGKSFRGDELDKNKSTTGDMLISYDYVTIKYSNTGTQQWVAEYDGGFSGNDEVKAIAIDKSDNIYITGFSEGFGTGYDCVTIKYNSYGVEQWVSRYNNINQNDAGYDIFIDENSYIYVAGYTRINTNKNDFLVIKYNESNGIDWAESFNNNNRDDIAARVKVDPSGNVYATGTSATNFESRPLSVKYDGNGDLQWSSFTGNSADLYTTAALEFDPSQNPIVLGKNASTPEISKYVTFKYTPDGTLSFQNNYAPCNGNFCENYAADMFIADDYSIYETGVSNTNTPGHNYNITTIKYSSRGNLEWELFYQGPTTQVPVASAIASFGKNQSFYVGGSARGFGGDFDFLIIKYSSADGDGDKFQKLNSFVPEKFELYNNYPNPFNPVTNIRFDLAESKFVNLVVYNSLGKEVKSLVNNYLEAGQYTAKFEEPSVASGLYFYRITAGNFIKTGKMLLIK